MASLHKQPGRPHWFCAFTDADGKRAFRSTRTADKKQAWQICQTWQKSARYGRVGQLSPERVREILSSGLAEIYLTANKARLPGGTVRDWCAMWLSGQEVSLKEPTVERYKEIVSHFVEFLGKAAEKDLSALSETQIEQFRDAEAKQRSRGTANLSLKLVRMLLRSAVAKDWVSRNVAAYVKALPREEGSRRHLTIPEIQRVLAACSDHQEWRGLVIFGLYSGQRISDLYRLTWRAVNMETGDIVLRTRKTGRPMAIPLIKPLRDVLDQLPASDDPNAFVFPTLAEAKRTSVLSNQFREILVEAGLVEPRSHASRSIGRTGRRERPELSFHSLRHSTVTLLKANGVADGLARAVVGHESAAVNKHYTHIGTDDLRRAMERMPDLTVG